MFPFYLVWFCINYLYLVENLFYYPVFRRVLFIQSSYMTDNKQKSSIIGKISWNVLVGSETRNSSEETDFRFV